MTEDTGAGVVDVIRAWVAARDIFDFVGQWERDRGARQPTVRARHAARAVPRAARGWSSAACCGCCATAGRRSTSRAVVAEFRAPMRRAGARAGVGASRGRIARARCSPARPSRLAADGARAARRSGPRCGRCCTPAFDVIDLAARSGIAALHGRRRRTGQVFDAARRRLAVGGDRRPAARRPVADAGPLGAARRPARRARRPDRRCAATSARPRRGRRPTSGSSARAMAMFTEIRRAEQLDITTLSVALRQLRNLALVTAAPDRLTPRGSARRPPRAVAVGSAGHLMAGSPLPLRAVAHRASSTSAVHAPRCTTGRSPERLGGTFVLRIEDTDEARNRPEWTQGIIDALAWIGIGSDDPAFEGPYFQSHERRRSTSPRRSRLFDAGPRVLLRPHRRGDPGAGEGSPASPATTATRATAGSARRPGGCCGSGCPTGTTVVHDVVRGEVTFDNESHRGLRAAARQRHADVPARQRRRRHRRCASAT